MPEFYNKLGYLAIASRLKRLSENLSSNVTGLYKEAGIDFEAKYFSIFYLLAGGERMSITEISGELEISHAAVNQTADEMESKGLIASAKEGQDKRKRYLSITPEGKKLMIKLQPLWEKIERANRLVFEECGSGFIGLINNIEALLKEKSMYERIKESGAVEILEEK